MSAQKILFKIKPFKSFVSRLRRHRHDQGPIDVLFTGDVGGDKAQRCVEMLGHGGQIAGQASSQWSRPHQQSDEGGGEGVQDPGDHG